MTPTKAATPREATAQLRYDAEIRGHVVVEDDACPECTTAVPIVAGARFATCPWCGEHFVPLVVLREQVDAP